jgi:D-alanine-D-alanine ligase
MKTVLVLGGGPDSEREVSLISSSFVAKAIDASGRFKAHREVIDRVNIDQLRALPGDVVFPVLHGGWGEGGPLQDLLEADGRPFVGSMSRAARHAMDKFATKLTAAQLGIATPAPAFVLDPRDTVCPIPFPVIMKPIHEGSTIGLFVCRDERDWARARATIDEAAFTGERRAFIVEPCITGAQGGKARELTVGIVDGRPLPVIEIKPADGLYDYEAKYTRNDTQYLLDPPLPAGVDGQIKQWTASLAGAMGVRHVARADFMLGADGRAWFLEINTMPGFTDHSLVPKAAAHAGMAMPALCAGLVDMAFRDA